VSEERDYVRRERHKDKGHPATIKLLLLRSFTVSLSKEARALHLNGEYCFRKKQVHNLLERRRYSTTVALRRLVSKSFVKAHACPMTVRR
jgi:hypothetical protein